MTTRRIRLAAVVYGVVTVLALSWGLLRGKPNLLQHPRPWLTLSPLVATVVSIAAGLLIALAVVKSTGLLVQRTRWARDLHVGFRSILGPLHAREIAFFAVTSGVAEELFFRGAMQPAWGLVVSSLVFGAVHIAPLRRFWPWTVWAAVMGFVFGILYEATGALIGPIVAHVLINYENMHFIDSYDPEPPADGAFEGREGDAKLVSSRVRTPR